MAWQNLKAEVDELFAVDRDGKEKALLAAKHPPRKLGKEKGANARYQREHMARAYARGCPKGTGRKGGHGNAYEPKAWEWALIADKDIPAERLAALLGISRALAYRLRKRLTTERAK